MQGNCQMQCNLVCCSIRLLFNVMELHVFAERP